MTEQTTSTSDDTGASAATGDTGASHMIPKARLDEEIGKRRAAEEALSKLADDLAQEVPEAFRALIPAQLGAAERVAWIRSAKSTGLFAAKPTVPGTDEGRATTTPREGIDVSTAPPLAKIASAYGKK
ncbi:hypothetical protein WDZ92_15195 [Nostoc sp. NIES-2111]